jgi:hypothetical protein
MRTRRVRAPDEHPYNEFSSSLMPVTACEMKRCAMEKAPLTSMT